MIKTVVIAAAGRGARMNHLSKDMPKHLIRVAGKPFLHYLLKLVDRVGFERIVVVIGYKADVMREFLEKQPYDIQIVEQSAVVGDKHGTAAVVESVESVVKDQAFVFINGDSLYEEDVLRSLMENDGLHHIVGAYHDDPTNYGVLEADKDNNLIRIVEKPKEPISNVVNLGIYTFQPEIFAAVKRVELSERGEYEIVDAINEMAMDKKVKMHQLNGGWVDLGKPEDISTVESYIIKVGLV